MAKQDDYVRYTIRIPAPLYERIKEAAGEKSVNAEIVARLEATIANETPDVVYMTRAQFADFEGMLKDLQQLLRKKP